MRAAVAESPSGIVVQQQAVAETITHLDPLTDSRWQAFVDSHPHGLAFHGTGWVASIQSAFGYKPRFLALEQDGTIMAAWPAMWVGSRLTGNRLVTMPFSHCAGPLVSTEEQATKLLKVAMDDANAIGAKSIEVRDWPSNLTTPPTFEQIDPFRRHVVDLSGGPEGVLANAGKDMRYSIRRAERNGVTVRAGTSEADMDIFYWMYCRQRRRQALLPQPKPFIREVFRRVVQTGNGFLVIAECEGQPVASLLSVNGSRTAIGTHSAALPQARDLRAIPLAMFRSMEMACERGLGAYDLGRTDKGALGLRHFKEEWGAVEVEMPYLYYPRPKGVNTKPPGGLGKSMLQLYCSVVPDPLFSTLSGLAYRHLG